jgi:hypothetical protein
MRSRWIAVALVSIALGSFAVRATTRADAAKAANSAPASGSAAASESAGTASSSGDVTIVTRSAEPTPRGPHVFQPPPVEPQEVLATMSREEIDAEISQISEELERRDAVNRLNKGTVSEDERDELGAMIYHASYLRTEIGRRELEDLKQKVDDYEKTHAARVAEYVHKPAKKTNN